MSGLSMRRQEETSKERKTEPAKRPSRIKLTVM